ncbi:hypothetical protein [Nocardia cyriacigeorgica]|uniref:hypothetical protein n=1 Tax=Nocardia cyriacigeorgica TaxID=135487 RepID=UPI0024573979|nr:hypothetical protein [Nocardia cyriacigeorgica]
MTVLRPVGIFREMYSGGHEELPSLFGSFTQRPIDDRSRIVDYLRAAPPVLDVLDVERDLIDNTHQITSAASLISDGTWIWRVDSIHYLSRYAIDIPDEFLTHVRGLDYRPPATVPDSEEFDAAMMDYF